jgi:hypothetical protein
VSDSQTNNRSPVASLGKSWISVSILLLIVALGTFVRLHNLTKQNLWIDEYRTLYLATGRGDSIYRLPLNQIIEHPPDVRFSGAPAWWHIWNGLNTTSHPPLYHIFLRFWVDLLGDSDQSIRGMSTMFSLGCIVLLYIAVRESGGDYSQALIAAGLTAFAPVEIYYSQQVRPYVMLQFIALAAGIILISIEKRGWSRARGILFSVMVLMLALTHYFCAGVIAGFAAYSIIRLRGGKRMAVLSAIVIPFVVFLVSWGPHIRNDTENGYGRIANRNLLHLVLSVPQRLTLESNHDPLAMADNGSWSLVIAMAIIAYLVPLLMLRRRRYLLLWWLWTACAIGLVFAIDILRHSTLLTMTRYVIPAAPGLYALLAAPLPGRIGKLFPGVILLGVLVFSVDYWQIGPPTSQDVADIANLTRREVLPGDLIIIARNYYYPPVEGPPMTYFAMAHYAGPWNGPIVFGTSLISKEVQLESRRYRRVWVVGVSPDSDTRKILPGWQVHNIQGSWGGNLLWYVTEKPSGKP